MKGILKKIDFFNEQIKITIKESDRMKTNLGGFFTILMILTILIFSWFLGNDIIYKTKPFSNSETQIGSTSFETYINPSNFSFAVVNLDAANKPVYDDRYFTISARFSKLEVNEQGESEFKIRQDISLVFCQKENFPLLTEEQFEGAQLKNFLCIDHKESYTLSGGFGENFITFVEIFLSMCDWEANPNYCKSKSEIDQYVNENFLNFNIFSPSLGMDVSNFDSPFVYYLLNDYKLLFAVGH